MVDSNGRSQPPSLENLFLWEHINLLANSLNRWTGRELFPNNLTGAEAAEWVYQQPFVLLSHDTQSPPRFTYGNQAAMSLFEMSWEQLIGFPSRQSAEPDRREARERLLQEVAGNGYVDGYSGVRISATGHRFVIEDVTVWNVLDDDDRFRGQAAIYSKWRSLK